MGSACCSPSLKNKLFSCPKQQRGVQNAKFARQSIFEIDDAANFENRLSMAREVSYKRVLCRICLLPSGGGTSQGNNTVHGRFQHVLIVYNGDTTDSSPSRLGLVFVLCPETEIYCRTPYKWTVNILSVVIRPVSHWNRRRTNLPKVDNVISALTLDSLSCDHA